MTARFLLHSLWLSTALAAGAAPVEITVGEPAGAMHRLLGVNIGPLPAGEPGNTDLTEAYRSTGITQIRTHDYYGPLDMATLYPNQQADPSRPESYRWQASDRVWRAIVSGGFEPYLRLGDSWNNGVGFPPAKPRAPVHRANFVRACVEVVRHYTDPALWGPSKVRYVEFWNEPDGRFWDSSPVEFYRLYNEAATALKAAFPQLQIGGPGFTPAGALTERGQRMSADFVRSAKESGAPLDFLSWHMYANDIASFERAAQHYTKLLRSTGLAKTTLHVTEYHTSHRNLTLPEQLAVRAGAKGAAILSAAWMLLQRYDVAEAMIYRGPDPALDAPQFYGLFYADARPKKPALAFGLWRDLCACPTRLTTRWSSADLAALGGRDERGRVALLVANLTDREQSWQCAGLPAALRLREVNDSSATVVERSVSGSGPRPIPPWGVQLVTAAG
ncbi:MAG: hypothetical protein IT204_03525 [Fimbriimonadaceae bacterium]|nr:hypothetical protein [Fimbriimonadaceae bacterium]